MAAPQTIPERSTVDLFKDRCELVAEAFLALDHLDPRLGEPHCPANAEWGRRVPRIVVGDVLICLDNAGWLVGDKRRTRVVAGEDLVASVAAMLRVDCLNAPAAFAEDRS